jgi:Glycosyltransferase (GlcNAc)
MTHSPTIFVSIAAYQDPHLWWTVKNAWMMASQPDRLRFGVIDQCVNSERAVHTHAPWAGLVRYVHVHPKYARGPCWARSLAYTLWNEETYILQIDSHMWFEHGWDERLIHEMAALQRESRHARHILTTYPGAFEFRDGEPVDVGSPKGVLVLRPNPGQTLRPDNPVMMFQAVPLENVRQRVGGYHVGAGCLFALGTLLQEVPYDPWLYFHGEEQNLAVRAWTRGWDIWHPFNMPILHLYKEGGGKEIVHWSPSEAEGRDFAWHDLEQRAARQLAKVFYDQSIKGAFGLGQVRSLAHYAQESGIDYVNKTVDANYVIRLPAPPAPSQFAPTYMQQMSYTLHVKKPLLTEPPPAS